MCVWIIWCSIMNFQDNKNIWACERLWPWIQTTDSLNSKYHSLWFWIQITEFKIKFCDFESFSVILKHWIQNQILWFWIQTKIQFPESNIIFCGFEFKSLNSKSNSVISNSNPWIQNHILRFWIQIPEFKIIRFEFENQPTQARMYACRGCHFLSLYRLLHWSPILFSFLKVSRRCTVMTDLF